MESDGSPKYLRHPHWCVLIPGLSRAKEFSNFEFRNGFYDEHTCKATFCYKKGTATKLLHGYHIPSSMSKEGVRNVWNPMILESGVLVADAGAFQSASRTLRVSFAEVKFHKV